MYAVWKNRRELIEYLLLDPRINVNHRSNGGSTVLHVCTQAYILKLLSRCMDLDVNIQNNWGQTGLQHLCEYRLKTCVKESLLDARANVLIRDNKGKTAWDVALGKKCSDIAKIVWNSRYTTLLRIPNKMLLYDIVRMIIEKYI